MLFLYFPEDKSEYLPAFISIAFFIVACVLTFIWFIKFSKKEEEKAKELERKILENKGYRSFTSEK